MRFNKKHSIDHDCRIQQWERVRDFKCGLLKCLKCRKEHMSRSNIYFKEKDDDIEIYCGKCFLNFLSNEKYVETSDCDEHDNPTEEEE